MKNFTFLKSFFMAMILSFLSISTFASTEFELVTLSFTEDKANRVELETTHQRWSVSNDDGIDSISFLNSRANSATNCADYSNPVRCYQGSSISISTQIVYRKIIKIVFHCSDESYATVLNNSIPQESGITSSVFESEVSVLLPSNPIITEFVIEELTAQTRINSIDVTLEQTVSWGGNITPIVPDTVATTIEQFLAAEESTDIWYKLTGVISNITNTTYGNFSLTDETGTVSVYGLTATKVASNDQSFATLGLSNGDTVTIHGTRASYNGTPQVEGPAYYISHKEGASLYPDAIFLADFNGANEYQPNSGSNNYTDPHSYTVSGVLFNLEGAESAVSGSPLEGVAHIIARIKKNTTNPAVITTEAVTPKGAVITNIGFTCKVKNGITMNVYTSPANGEEIWSNIYTKASTEATLETIDIPVELSDEIKLKFEFVITNGESTGSNRDSYLDLIYLKGTSPKVLQTPVISPASGFLIEPTEVSITAPEGEIRYTLDGNEPTEESQLYTEPFTVTSNVTVKAIAIGDNAISHVATAIYTFPTDVANIEALLALEEDVVARIQDTLIVVAQAGASNEYMWVTDNTTPMLIYKRGIPQFNPGSKLVGLIGSHTIYRGAPQIEPIYIPNPKAEEPEPVEPISIELKDVTAENVHQYVRIDTITYENASYLTDGNIKKFMYNRFNYNYEGKENDHVNVIGIVGLVDSVPQLYPMYIEKVALKPTYSWSIENNATLDMFYDAVLTFEGDFQFIEEVVNNPYCFYKKDTNGEWTFVEQTSIDNGEGWLRKEISEKSIQFIAPIEHYGFGNNQFCVKGEYRIVVPAGSFKLVGDSEEYFNDEIILEFSIENDYAVDVKFIANPENKSKVEELQEIVLTILNHAVQLNEIRIEGKLKQVRVYREDINTAYPIKCLYGCLQCYNSQNNSITFTRNINLPLPFNEEGKYTIEIPQGLFSIGGGPHYNKPFNLTYTIGEVNIKGNVKRALQTGSNSIILTHEEDGTAHIYSIDNETLVVSELSQEGTIARDAENAGDYLAISDIALTEDGKLVACNYIRCQFDASSIDANYQRGILNVYIWNNLEEKPSIWFQSQASSNSLRSDQGYTMAVKGTSTNASVLVSGVHNSQRGIRMSRFNIIDGQYIDTQNGAGALPYYYYIGSNFKGASAGVDAAVYNEDTHGVNIQFNASPLTENGWIFDAELVEPSEFLDKGTNGAEVEVKANIAEGTFGKKFNGTSYLTIDDQVLMAAPYANEEGLLTGVKVLDITNGFDKAIEFEMTAVLDNAIDIASAAVTLIASEEDSVIIYLFAGSQIYTFKQSVAIELPMEVEFENIAAIYEKGMWDKGYYEEYKQWSVIAILKSQPTVVDVIKSTNVQRGEFNFYYLNDGTGTIVLKTDGNIINPIHNENWETIGWDTIPGVNIEIGKKLPTDLKATIDFKCITSNDFPYLPTGEVYGAPVMTYVPKETGDTIVSEDGWKYPETESNADFVARCEDSDFTEDIVTVNVDDLLSNRLEYAGKLLNINAEGKYYAEIITDKITEQFKAYMYWDAEDAFGIVVEEEHGPTEEESTTYVYISPKYTEDWNNYAGKLFNVIGKNLPEAAFDANETINVVKARFDWNAITIGQSLIVKDYTIGELGENPVDVENSEFVVSVYANNGAVYVEAEAGAMIEVYTISGICAYAGVSNTTTTIINGLTDIAIIRVNGKAYKMLVE